MKTFHWKCMGICTPRINQWETDKSVRERIINFCISFFFLHPTFSDIFSKAVLFLSCVLICIILKICCQNQYWGSRMYNFKTLCEDVIFFAITSIANDNSMCELKSFLHIWAFGLFLHQYWNVSILSHPIPFSSITSNNYVPMPWHNNVTASFHTKGNSNYLNFLSRSPDYQVVYEESVSPLDLILCLN